MKFVIIITLLCILNDTHALPKGSDKTCSSLTPDGPGIGFFNPSRVSISAKKSGNKVQVKILSSDKEKFQEFMLQARSASNPNIFIDGEFTTSKDSTTIDCFGKSKNTLTQVDATNKTEIITEWTPRKASNQYIRFRATVATDSYKTWTEIDSEFVRMTDGSVPDKDLDRHPAYAGCFSTKGCYAHPGRCIQEQNCNILLSWSNAEDEQILFEIHGCIDSFREIGFALSNDTLIGDDSTMVCFKDGDKIILRERIERNGEKRSQAFPEDSYGISITDGLTTCAWLRPYRYETLGQTYNLLEHNYTIVLTTKETYRNYPNSMMLAGNPANFTAVSELGDACEPYFAKLPGNGSLEYPYFEPGEYDPNSMCRRDIRLITTVSPTKSSNSVSEIRFSLFSLATLGLFYASKEVLFTCFGVI